MKATFCTLLILLSSLCHGGAFPKNVPTAHDFSYTIFQNLKKYMQEVRKQGSIKIFKNCVDIYLYSRTPLKACVGRKFSRNKLVEQVKFIGRNLKIITFTYIREGSNLTPTSNHKLQFLDFLERKNQTPYIIKVSNVGLFISINYDLPESISIVSADKGRYRQITREYYSPELSWKKYRSECEDCDFIFYKVSSEALDEQEFKLSYYSKNKTEVTPNNFWSSFNSNFMAIPIIFSRKFKYALINELGWPDI